ncbi:MAG: hypothetical protein LBK99_13210 [Opitutaceae bacterium]|jgi:hypothetical protein|nr:hypothetical protein [Opitutaceae bacterium]
MHKITATGLFILFVGGPVLLTGCSTYSKKSASLDTAFRTGNLPIAVEEVDKLAVKNADSKKDSLIYHLEQGAVLRAAALAADSGIVIPALAPGSAKKSTGAETTLTSASPRDLLLRSNTALDAAEGRANEWEEEAKVKVGSEAGAAFTNLANLPYRGRGYDKVMLSTYKALNHLQLGDTDSARVELNRAFRHQAAAVEENARRIAAQEKEIEDAREGRLASEDGQKVAGFDVAGVMATIESSPEARADNTAIEAVANSRPYADYVNPFSVLLDGLFFENCAMDSDDLEHARKSFERLSSMVPGNAYIKQDLADINAGKPSKGITYVIYESGSAPYREERKITLPVSLVSNSPMPNVVIAWPYLKFYDSSASPISIAAAGAGDAGVSPALVCDMNSVIARDFKNEWPAILTKSIISSAAKAIIDAGIQAGVKSAMKDQGATGQIVQLFAKVGTLVTQAAVTIADTRQWRSLPKEFHYARLQTPADRVLIIRGTAASTQGAATPAASVEARVALQPGSVNVVYVKSIAPGQPLLVSQFTLKGGVTVEGGLPPSTSAPLAPAAETPAPAASASSATADETKRWEELKAKAEASLNASQGKNSCNPL